MKIFIQLPQKLVQQNWKSKKKKFFNPSIRLNTIAVFREYVNSMIAYQSLSSKHIEIIWGNISQLLTPKYWISASVCGFSWVNDFIVGDFLILGVFLLILWRKLLVFANFVCFGFFNRLIVTLTLDWMEN